MKFGGRRLLLSSPIEGRSTPMFDFDASKLIVIGIAALLLIGPKDLPRVLRQVGQYVAKMRRMAGEFQQQFSDAMRDSELQDLKKDMEKMAQDAKLDLNTDALRQTERDLRDAIDNAGKPVEVAKAAEPKNPTPDNDPDGAFIQVDIPRAADVAATHAPADGISHMPVREVGLDSEPAQAQTLGQTAAKV